jgi:excisionase family DNA binding protein
MDNKKKNLSSNVNEYCKSYKATDDILTLQEIVGYLKVDKKTIYRMVKENHLPAFRVGSLWRFKREDVDNWIEKVREK